MSDVPGSFKKEGLGRMINEEDLKADVIKTALEAEQAKLNDRAWREAAEWVRGLLRIMAYEHFDKIETLQGACRVLSKALDPETNPKLKEDKCQDRG